MNDEVEKDVSDVSLHHIQNITEAAAYPDWDDDPRNPRNWSGMKKWVTIGIISLYAFISPMATSMMAPALPDIAAQYNITNPTILALSLSIFLLSFALAPLFLAPLSEIYGRTWIYHIGNLVFIGTNIGCAFSPTTGCLIAFRFLAGWPGAAPLAIGGGSVSDLFSERERAGAMAMFTLGPLLGPVFGPIIGGFITQSVGVKYVFITISGFSAFGSLIGIPFLRETYAPVIQRRILKDPNHPVLKSSAEDLRIILWNHLSRPAILLTRSFICFILSLYMALSYGIYYLMFATFPTLFSETYHFSTGIGGLAYIGLGVGFMVATVFGAKISSTIYTTLADRNGGIGTPEMRIPSLIIGSICSPIGILWYGWSAQEKLHWIMPMMGTAILGFGIMTCFLPIQLYLVDAFFYSASALSAAAVFRSLLGFAFPLFGSQMYDRLGIGSGNTLLASLAIFLGIPFSIWIWFRGAKIRGSSSLTR